DTNALEAHLRRSDGYRRVESHLVPETVIGRRVEPRTLCAANDDEVTFGLETGRDRPLHFGWIVHVHVGVHDGDVLDVVMGRQCAKDDIPGLPRLRIVDLDVEVIATRAAA